VTAGTGCRCAGAGDFGAKVQVLNSAGTVPATLAAYSNLLQVLDPATRQQRDLLRRRSSDRRILTAAATAR
jgi:hypothetical protein